MECLVLSWEVRRIASEIRHGFEGFGITNEIESLRGCPQKKRDIVGQVLMIVYAGTGRGDN